MPSFRALSLACAVLLTACSSPDTSDSVASPVPERGVESAERPGDPADLAGHLAYFKDLDTIEDPVERCLAYPELPGNAWPAGSVEARCVLLSPSPFDVRDLARILDEDGAEALDALFADALERHYADPEHAELHFKIFFAIGARRLDAQVARRWRLALPDSPFALLATALQQKFAIGNAIKEPGAGASLRVIAMIENFRQVLRMEPRLTFACVMLLDVSIRLRDEALGDEAEAHCLEHNPLSWHVADAVLRRHDPRNDGAPVALAEATERLRRLSQAHPILASLAARDIGLAGLEPYNRRDYAAALAAFEEAARLSPDPYFIGMAGRVYLIQGDNHRSAYMASQALRLAPKNVPFRAARATARRRIGDLHGSIEDSEFTIANTSDPHSSYFVVYGSSLWDLGRREEARGVFAYTMRFPEQRQWAFWRLCETWIKDVSVGAEGLECTEHLVEEFPDDAESLFLRAWALHKTRDDRTRTYVERFRSAYDPGDNRQAVMLSELQRVGAAGAR